MTEHISLEEYRRLAGLPQRGRPPEEFQPPTAPTAARGKAHHALGRIADGAMNKSEARYEREVLVPAKAAGTIAWYAFGAVKLKLAPRTFLTVDFFVLPAAGVLECVDVKGALAIYEEDAKAKMKIAAASFPFVFKIAIPRRLRDGGGWTIIQVGKD